jgi:predicted branched-subunit amino acid permease
MCISFSACSLIGPTMFMFRRGMGHALPFVVMIVPFAVLFGVVSREAGLAMGEAIVFSMVVVAGTAQFTALQLMMDNAPLAIVIASALAVNLRLVMYSASINPHFGHAPRWMRAVVAYLLVDQTYAQSIVEFDRTPNLTLMQKFAYFMGNGAVVYPLWLIGTAVGVQMGQVITTDGGLDFALPIAFLAMVGPMLRTPAHWAAAFTAAALSLICFDVPYDLGLIIGGIGGMISGAWVEKTLSSDQSL